MITRRWLAVAALALATGACNREDGEDGSSTIGPTTTAPGTVPPPSTSPDRARHERLAERLATALRDPEFRSVLYRKIGGSAFREQKVHLQEFLDAGGGLERRRLARLTGESEETIRADLDQGAPIEVYLPVPEHRGRWQGDADLIVATAETDQDAPVGFDLFGRRQQLRQDRPPTTPVLMVSRAEQVFGPGPSGLICLPTCTGGDGGTVTLTPGLYLTRTQFTGTFESWFKGSPEFEVHVLGQDGTTNRMMSYQCAGEHAGGGYAFDQNSTTWSGNVLLFTSTQFAAYNQLHPGQNVRIFVLEDDDTACQIKVDSTRAANLFKQLKLAYGSLSGGRDSTSSSLLRFFTRATVLVELFRAAASFIKTNDEIVGNAVADSVAASRFFPGGNWVVKGENSVAFGALKLEMK